jgi:hypothetical protein
MKLCNIKNRCRSILCCSLDFGFWIFECISNYLFSVFSVNSSQFLGFDCLSGGKWHSGNLLHSLLC